MEKSKKDYIDELMRIDMEFANQSQSKKELAWHENLAEDAVMVTGGHRPYVFGRDNIVKGISGLYQLENLKFKWEPKLADVSEDYSMGFTTGTYTRSYELEGQKISEIGKYTTVWKRVGSVWKIALDIGNEENESI